MVQTVEEWRVIDGYNGVYEVSSLGRVRSIDHYTTQVDNGTKCEHFYKGKLLKCVTDHYGYHQVELSGKKKKVHQLVARAFIANPDNLEIINHKDENRSNNAVENLEWCDRPYNVRYSLSKPVESFDLTTGDTVKKYKSIAEAVLDGHTRSAISSCVHKKLNHHHGFGWRFAEA